jgi:subtilisin-like proprotein convertase family protein
MRWWLVLCLVGCGFHTHGAGGDDDTDAPPPGIAWTLDTADDFAGSGYETHAVTIEPSGMLTQAAYAYGGLLVHGLPDMELWSPATPTPMDWDASAGVTSSGAALWTGEYFDTISADFTNLGIADTGTFSLWLEGEVYLDANDVLLLDADGAGFVDLYIDGAWQQLLVGKSDGPHTSAPLATAGWYPIRIGYGQGGASGHLDVRHGTNATLVPFTRDRLRTDVSAVHGTMRLEYYRQIFGGAHDNLEPPISHLEEADLIASLPQLETYDWSMRWYGQVHIDEPGTYTFVVASDDGHQLHVGTSGISTHWGRDDAFAGMNQLGANLDAGWNDLVLDYNQVLDDQTLSVTMNGAAIPLAQLRPVEPRGDRLITQSIIPATPVTVQNDTGSLATLSATIAGYPGETVTAIDITVSYTTQHRDQLVFKLAAPNGQPVTIQNHTGTGGGTGLFDQIHVTDPQLVGGPAAGTWVLGLGDDVTGGNNSALREFHVTLHTSGGPEQVATTATYVTPVHALGGALARITDVAWIERAPLASEVAVRACEQADCSDAPAWSEQLAQHATPMLPAAPYLQARITLHSDGARETELDSLTIRYQTR